MARLAFFSESLPSPDDSNSVASGEISNFSYGLMTSLADQQHEVRVFSTYREGDNLPISHPRLQIIRPFRKWSWLEIPRLLPALLDFQPEILHFIQPRKEAFGGWTNATIALPTLAPLIGRPRVIVSLYDVRKSELQRNRILISLAETVIVANRQQADELAVWLDELKNSARRPAIEIVSLPPTSGARAQSETESSSGLSRLQDVARKLIFVPGDLDEQSDLDGLSEVLNDLMSTIPDLGVVIGGGWGRLSSSARRAFMRKFEDRQNGSRILLTGPLAREGEFACLEAASVVLLAGHPGSSLSLARLVRESLQTSRPLVMNSEQQRLDPLRWRDRETAFIVEQDPRTWAPRLAEALLDESLRREIGSRLPDFARDQIIDEPGNAMSRIYAQVLRAPRKPLR